MPGQENKGASVEFVRKMNLSGAEEEPCDRCAAVAICKLRELLHKVKIADGIAKHETLITICGLQIPTGQE